MLYKHSYRKGGCNWSQFFPICLKNCKIHNYLFILVTAASSQIKPKLQSLLQEDGAKQVSAVMRYDVKWNEQSRTVFLVTGTKDSAKKMWKKHVKGKVEHGICHLLVCYKEVSFWEYKKVLATSFYHLRDYISSQDVSWKKVQRLSELFWT